MDLIKGLAQKIDNKTYSKMVVDHLASSTADNFEMLCGQISMVQRLVSKQGKSGGKSVCEKEVQLASAKYKPGTFKGLCGNCGKVCGYVKKTCPHPKAEKQDKGTASSGKGANSNKTCNHCGKKGHVEEGCWKKHPSKAPKWFQEKGEKSEGGTKANNACVELVLASIDAYFQVARS